MLALLVATLSLLFARVEAQTVQTVQVGDDGFFFVPPTVTAQVGDIITFVFVGRNHSVTQSSLDDPCIPLDGGFDSGLVGVGNDTTAPPPIWNLTITDASAPIWYFCDNPIPVSHCTAGMVGAINPPSQDDYNQFLSAAKAASVTLSATELVAFTGVGAFATNTPSPTGTANFTATTAGSSSSSHTPSSTAKSDGRRSASLQGALLVSILTLMVYVLM